MQRQNISSGGPYEEPYGYSRAVKVGNQVHVAGTCAQPPNVEGVGAYDQAVDALNTISVALTAADASAADVVRTRVPAVISDSSQSCERGLTPCAIVCCQRLQ